MFVDVCFVIDTLWADSSKSVSLSKLHGMIAYLKNQQILLRELLLPRFSFASISSIFRYKESVVNRLYLTTNSQKFFMQNKYNLFREENEGYAKLITWLWAHPDASCSDLKKDILLFIGYFQLDPNRVLDIVIFFYKCHLDKIYNSGEEFIEEPDKIEKIQQVTQSWNELLKWYPKHHLIRVLGFNFQGHQNTSLFEPSRTSLFRVAAHLIEDGIVPLEHVYAYLAPSSEELIRSTEEFEKTAKQLSTARAGEIQHWIASSEQERAFLTNQKYLLLEAMLKLPRKDVTSAWNENSLTRKLFDLLSHTCPTRYPPIAKGIARILRAVVEPTYQKISLPNCLFAKPGSPVTLASLISLVEETDPFLNLLEVRLSVDANLWTVLCRIYKTLLTKLLERVQKLEHQPDDQPAASPSDVSLQECARILAKLEDILTRIMLPSMSLLKASASFEIWEILKKYPYIDRYRMYYKWHTLTIYPELNLFRAYLTDQIKRLMRRTTTDNVKTIGKQLGRLANNYPHPIFHVILQQVQYYVNLIQPIVECLKYFTAISYDVLTFCMLECLAKPRRSVKLDGTHTAGWLTYLSAFIGSIYKKYGYKLDFVPILDYLEKRCRQNNVAHLLVWKEVLVRTGCVQLHEEAYDEQLHMLNAGPGMAKLALSGVLQQNEKAKSSISPLLDALIQRHSWLRLYLLIAQQQTCSLYETHESNLSVLSTTFDQVHEILLLFAEFIKQHIFTKKAFMRQFASHSPQNVVELIRDHAVEPETIFYLYRGLLPSLYQDVGDLRSRARSDEAVPSRRLSKEIGQIVQLSEEGEFCIKQVDAESLARAARRAYPSSMHADLFVAFWSLSLQDVYFPESVYEAHFAGLSASAQEVQCLVEKRVLLAEQAKQVAHVNNIVKKLELSKGTWFRVRHRDHPFTRSSLVCPLFNATLFLQHCVIPRCRYSAEDALFCFEFVKLLHRLRPPGWETVAFFEQLFAFLPLVVGSSTELEVERKEPPFFNRLAMIFLTRTSEVFPTYRCFAERLAFFVKKLSSHPEMKTMASRCNMILQGHLEGMRDDEQLSREYPEFEIPCSPKESPTRLAEGGGNANRRASVQGSPKRSEEEEEGKLHSEERSATGELVDGDFQESSSAASLGSQLAAKASRDQVAQAGGDVSEKLVRRHASDSASSSLDAPPESARVPSPSKSGKAHAREAKGAAEGHDVGAGGRQDRMRVLHRGEHDNRTSSKRAAPCSEPVSAAQPEGAPDLQSSTGNARAKGKPVSPSVVARTSEEKAVSSAGAKHSAHSSAAPPSISNDGPESKPSVQPSSNSPIQADLDAKGPDGPRGLKRKRDSENLPGDKKSKQSDGTAGDESNKPEAPAGTGSKHPKKAAHGDEQHPDDKAAKSAATNAPKPKETPAHDSKDSKTSSTSSSRHMKEIHFGPVMPPHNAPSNEKGGDKKYSSSASTEHSRNFGQGAGKGSSDPSSKFARKPGFDGARPDAKSSSSAGVDGKRTGEKSGGYRRESRYSNNPDNSARGDRTNRISSHSNNENRGHSYKGRDYDGNNNQFSRR
ncbi:THO complex subunit 2-like [Schistocerca gregaria]|uniref:THO complex subunit 2-like n=1 Tax=Schistocerca gregaria TaxID=7010 RepID=UPI00211F2326|nr:THO complex subunit 2-like [Schistocerca gregaria]